MIATFGTEAESILRGIGAVLWPVVVVVSVFVFKGEIGRLISRIRKGRIFGQEFETSLDELESGAESLEAISPETDTRDLKPSERLVPRRLDSDIDRILTVSATSPEAALMQLGATLEREGRRILAVGGHENGLRHFSSLREIAVELDRVVALPRGTQQVFQQFANIRNSIVHGHAQASEREVLRAIDSGITLLRSLEMVAQEKHFVHHSGVPIYSDPSATQALDGCAVILNSVSPGGLGLERKAFPTTLQSYVEGMEVSWDWSLDNRWGEAWFKDPDDGEIKYAWTSSAEFVGRDLE